MAQNLKFMKCVFFTHQQYNVDKIHIPTQSLYIEEDVEIRNSGDLENHINRIIDNIYNNLNRDNRGAPIKIPAPIFALVGRKLDYDSSIFDGEIMKTPYKTPFVYGKDTITPSQDGSLAIVSYFRSFFKSGLGEQPKDEDNYKASLANSYKFKGRLKVIIYVPYMTNKYKYVTNFTDIINSSRFFYSLITNDNFLNFKKTTLITYDELKKKYKNLSDRTIYRLIDILKGEDAKKFNFYEDLMKLCSEGGCVADEGEDFSRMIPEYTDDEGKNNENAIKQSPFLPNKCLAQTRGYINNIKNATNHNKDLPDFLKTHAMKELRESLEKYIQVSDNIAKDKNTDVNPDDISSYKSPVDLIIAIINKYIKNYYSTNLNDEKRDDIPLNHYSKNYSRNIINELSMLRKFYPGVPEVVMSLYLFDENRKTDKLIYMPWGRTLVSGRNVLALGELFEVNKTLFSFNNRFAMTINTNGIIYVYDRNSGYIIYFLNRNPTPNTQGMIFETTSVDIEFLDVNNNRKSKSVFKTSFIDNCDGCNSSPFNLILDDNNGAIVIYANSFLNATNRDFKSFLDKEMNYMSDLRRRGMGDDYNINNPQFVKLTGKKIEEVPREEEYIWRT